MANGRRWSVASLGEQLLQTRQAKLNKAVEEAAPKAWKAGKTTIDGQTTVTSKPYRAEQSPEHTKLLEDHGYDPERFKIVGPIRQSSWTAYIPEANRDESGEFVFQAKAYKFQVIERPEGELSIDELIEAIDNRTPYEFDGDAREPRGQGVLDPDVPYVVALGDTQIGKVENDTTELLDRVFQLLDRAAKPLLLYKMRTGETFKHVHMAWLGDCIEGMNSQGGRLRWRTTLTITEQVKILRRVMLYAVELFAPLTDRLTVISVPGNHDEASSRDMDTRMDDSWAVEALNQVSDAIQYNEERFGHVECYVPGPDEQGVVMEVGNTVVAHIHGHTIRAGQHFKWWAGQALGGTDYGRATLLLQGHLHHWHFEEDGFRKWMGVSALERISIWWLQKTGTGGSPGLVTFQLWENEITNLSKLEPPKLEEAA